MADGAAGLDTTHTIDTIDASAQGKLKSLIERIERLEEDKKGVSTDLKEVYAEAKGDGFDTKIIRKVVRLRAQDKAKRLEEEALIELYLSAIRRAIRAAARAEEGPRALSGAEPMNAPIPDLAAAALPLWSLEDLYSGPDDPRIEADLEAARAANAELAALEGRLLEARAEPARLDALIARGVGLYEQVTNALWSVGAYAGLAASVSRDDPSWSRFEADVRARSSAIAASSLFFTLELNALEGRRDRGGPGGRPGRRPLAAVAAPGAAVPAA